MGRWMDGWMDIRMPHRNVVAWLAHVHIPIIFHVMTEKKKKKSRGFILGLLGKKFPKRRRRGSAKPPRSFRWCNWAVLSALFSTQYLPRWIAGPIANCDLLVHDTLTSPKTTPSSLPPRLAKSKTKRKKKKISALPAALPQNKKRQLMTDTTVSPTK